MNDREVDIDERLAHLAAATRDITPRADFTARVMQAVQAEQGPLFVRAMVRAGRRFVPVAAIAAAVALVWAVRADDSLDEVLATYDATELPW